MAKLEFQATQRIKGKNYAALTCNFLTLAGLGLELPYEPIEILPFFDLLSPLPIVKFSFNENYYFLELQNYVFFIRKSTINDLYIVKAFCVGFYLPITNKKFYLCVRIYLYIFYFEYICNVIS